MEYTEAELIEARESAAQIEEELNPTSVIVPSRIRLGELDDIALVQAALRVIVNRRGG